MKWIIALLLFPIMVCARPFSSRIDTSSTNLTTSWLLVPLPTENGVTIRPRQVASVQVDDRTTSSEVGVNCNATTTSAPASDLETVWAAGSETYSTGTFNAGQDCWIKAQTGTISSGIVTVLIEGN